MDNNKNKILTLIAIITIILTLIGATYAYFAAQAGGTTSSNATVTSNTTDLLTFSMNQDISFTVTQADFAENGNNKSGEATATATLTPNNKTGAATMNYYLYLNIESNPTVYSSTNTNHDPELMLQVFDGNNQLVTLTGLGTEKTIKGVTGYDITGVSGLKTLLDNHAISASNNTATIENWRVVITLINLDVNQNDNTGKQVSGTLMIRREEVFLCDLYPSSCLTLNISNSNNFVGKSVTFNSSDVNAIWNNKYNQLEVLSVGSSNEGTLTSEQPIGTTLLNTYIIGLTGTTQGEGEVVNENGYRYEGRNPNNYVMFNNELWRIVGVFETNYDNDGDDVVDSTGNLVKIVRMEPIDNLKWNINNTNDWPNSVLYHLLNEQYYNWKQNKNSVGNNCFVTSGLISVIVFGNCDYSFSGIKDNYRNFISNVKWYLGGAQYGNNVRLSAQNAYNCERNSSNVYDGNSFTTMGYIGLLYPSDYLYGVLASSCSRGTNFYFSTSCAGNDWLYEYVGWLISPCYDNQDYAWRIDGNGMAVNSKVGSEGAITPTLYLKPSTYKISGSGTSIDPYIIGI